jgi:SAM-dependent methyltransferase
MTNPLLASLFNLRRHRSSFRRVLVLLDPETGVDTAEIFRVTRPWQSWMTITGVVTADRASVAAALLTTDARQADILLCLSNDGAIKTIVRAACLDGGRTFIDPTLAPQDTREHALYQEVLHHDFELGGFNEWTGKDAQYSSAVLRMMSATHCRMAFPAYAAKPLAELWQQNGGRPLQALDVGCGAISRLRWGALSGLLTITGVDPLLDMYSIVRERHGYTALPEIRCTREIVIGAEDLRSAIAPGSFDFVYCANALDHTEDPGRVIESIAAALRIGGVFAVDVYTREGSRENWWQLHQFDMYLNDRSEFVAETRDGVVRPLVPPGCGLVVREIAGQHETTALILERVHEEALKKTA